MLESWQGGVIATNHYLSQSEVSMPYPIGPNCPVDKVEKLKKGIEPLSDMSWNENSEWYHSAVVTQLRADMQNGRKD